MIKVENAAWQTTIEIIVANQKKKYFDCLLAKTKEPLGLSVIPRELEFCINGKKHM